MKPGMIHCGVDNTAGFAITVGHDIGSAYIEITTPALSGQPTKVYTVRITDPNTVSYDYEPASGMSRGDVQLTLSGTDDPAVHSAGSYKFSGNIPATSTLRGHVMGSENIQNAPLEPFEIDVTCP